MANQSGIATPVFLWKNQGRVAASQSAFEQEAILYGLERVRRVWHTPVHCPFCCTPFQNTHLGDEFHLDMVQDENQCRVCGYYNKLVTTLHFTAIDMRKELGQDNVKDQIFHYPVLRTFDINDAQLPFNELGAWIAKNPETIYKVTPRRFEELIEDIFRNMGYATRLTRFSKDDGVDIYLIEKTGAQAIVQVKRCGKDNKVGVELVDQVRGLKLRPVHRNVTKAYIVTSSSFTRGAIARANEQPVITEFEMELIDCERLMKELGTYNAPIASLSDEVRVRLQHT